MEVVDLTTKYEDESFYFEYKPKYKVFHELMAKRMNNVLLVSSIYDSFMIEEDGRLSDQIYEEFRNLNLRTLPRITRVCFRYFPTTERTSKAACWYS